jgi:hypothetical protein
MRSERGSGLIEILIAIAIIAIMSIAGMVGLTSSSKATLDANIRTTARSIAVSQMNTVMTFDYVKAPSGGYAEYSHTIDPSDISPPSNYSISSLDRNNNKTAKNTIYGIPWDLTNHGVYAEESDPIDSGIQKITIIVSYENKEILRLVDLKVDR